MASTLVVFNKDSEPSIIAAGEYKALYITILSLITLGLFIKNYKYQSVSCMVLFIQFPCLLTFSLLYGDILNNTILSEASRGINTTLYDDIYQVDCSTVGECVCVPMCIGSENISCVNNPCIINLMPNLGVYQCDIEPDICYNQTIISTLSYGGILYLYKNSTYTYASYPAASETHNQTFLTWDPERQITQNGPNSLTFVTILISVFYILLTLIASCPIDWIGKKLAEPTLINSPTFVNSPINDKYDEYDNVDDCKPPIYEDVYI